MGEQPKFAQIYIHDGTVQVELENRQRHMGLACLPEMKVLQHILQEVNPCLILETRSLLSATQSVLEKSTY